LGGLLREEEGGGKGEEGEENEVVGAEHEGA
jgi:hypothetical protein